MLLLSASLVAIVFGVYHSSLGIGFLLDDFYHMGYLIAAFDGDNAELLKCLFGSWSGPTGLNSFRPLTSLGLMVDFVLWKTDAAGYHLSNLLMYSCCCVAVFLLVRHLLHGLGRFAAVSAYVSALLFLVYPIHPESVAWIIGRVDTQCVLFFLLSILFYFKHRKKANVFYVILSFLFFLCSLTTKEMAVVLPVVVLASEVFLAKDLGWRMEDGLKRFILPVSYFIFLAVFAFVRTSAIGTLVGGYGSSDLKTTLLMFRNFLDTETIKKIICGVNEENPLQIDLFPWARLAFGLSIVPVFISLFNTRFLRLTAFLIVWLLISLLPTFQIWHIYPNLVGSRLFFLGSVPLVMLIGIAATLPFAEYPQRLCKVIPALRVVTTLSAVALISIWTVAVHKNLEVWTRAGDDIRKIHAHIGSLATSDDKFIHLLDVPQDDAGAGLIGRPEYLGIMLSPPIADDQYHERVLTTERCLARNREFIYPQLVRAVAESDEVKSRLIWSNSDKRYKNWLLPGGIEPGSQEKDRLITLPLHLSNGEEQIVSGTKIWCKTGGINPFKAGWVKLHLPENTDLSGSQVRLLYRSREQPPFWLDYSQGPYGEPDLGEPGTIVFVPGWHRSWLLNGEVEELGVEFLHLSEPLKVAGFNNLSLEVLPAERIFPTLAISDSSKRKEVSISRRILLPCDSISPIKVRYDTSKVDGGKYSLVMVAKPEVSLTVNPTKQLPDPALLLYKKEVADREGTISIPDKLIYRSVGRHQVVVCAIDDEHQPVGYLSEPRIFEICPDRPPEID